MNALIVTVDNSTYFPVYKISGPMTGQEAANFTKEAYLVILLCDAKTARANKEEYDKFLTCVSNSPLRCKKETQIKSMEYLVGTTLSELVSIESFPEPVRIKFENFNAPINTSDETDK
jgi:hypothetical protein